MKRWSRCCFHRQSHGWGPSQNRPRWATAPPCPSPNSIRPWLWGRQDRKGRLRRAACRLPASTGAARTAHTPPAGRGAQAITPQSPAAKIRPRPCTTRVGWVRTRPRPSQGKPLSRSQAGARLPVQSTVARSGAAGSWRAMERTAMPWACTMRSRRRASGALPSRRPPGAVRRLRRHDCRRRRQRAANARTTSTAAAPLPITSTAAGRWLHQSRKDSRGRTGRPVTPAGTAVTLPTSRLSQSQRRERSGVDGGSRGLRR